MTLTKLIKRQWGKNQFRSPKIAFALREQTAASKFQAPIERRFVAVWRGVVRRQQQHPNR
jgi:hypothetical protein